MSPVRTRCVAKFCGQALELAAQRALLAAALHNCDAVATVDALIDSAGPQVFRGPLRALAEAITEAAPEVLGPVAAADLAARRSGHDGDALLGIAFELLAEPVATSPSQLARWADAIREADRRRTLIVLAHQLAEAAAAGDTDAMVLAVVMIREAAP